MKNKEISIGINLKVLFLYVLVTFVVITINVLFAVFADSLEVLYFIDGFILGVVALFMVLSLIVGKEEHFVIW